MASIEVNQISKRFGGLTAVDEVDFQVEPGEIFGLLGPNGAGKTTTIRILLDILKPDSGSVAVLGGPMTEEKKNRIGYLPEERGLYQDIPLERCLVYLATLKGLSQIEAHRRVGEYLERFDLASSRKKKVKEMSKGMQQKAQLITTLVHQPSVVIIDEPFSALDPVNTQMIKDLLREQRSNGVTIIMCTHQMHQVEELCDRLVLIDKGKTVLYGHLDEIRHRFASHEVLVKAQTAIPEDIPGVERVGEGNSEQHYRLLDGTTSQDFLQALVQRKLIIEKFEIAMPTLDEIFIQVVQGAENA
jgi:ABC-2 type transport system ATP-binding protein